MASRADRVRPGIAGVVLRARDVARLADFYATVVGLPVIEDGPDGVVCASGGERLLTIRAATDYTDAPRAGAPGLYHIAFVVPTRADLGRWMRSYAARGGPGWQGASDHRVSEAVYLSDPEGNGIEVYRDRPRAEWTVSASGEVEMSVDRLDVDSLIRAADAADAGSEHTPRAAGAPASDAMRPIKFAVGHVHLQVADIAAAEAYYTNTLGMAVTARFRDSAVFMSWDGYHHHIALNTWARLAWPARTAGEPGLEAIVARPPHSNHTGSGTDPSGVKIIIG